MTIASGVITKDDGLTHQSQLAADPDFDPEFSQLLDFTQVTKVALSAADVRLLASTTIFSPGSRRAFLTNTEELFGLSRMFGILREGVGEPGVRVFRSRDEALQWLFFGK